MTWSGSAAPAAPAWPANRRTTKARALTDKSQHHSRADLVGRLNAVLRGWCEYLRHGVSKATFGNADPYITGEGNRPAIGTFAERSTRCVMLLQLPTDHTAEAVRDA